KQGVAWRTDRQLIHVEAALSNGRDMRPRRSARYRPSLAVPLLLLIAVGCTPDQPSSGGANAGAPTVALKVRILPTRGGAEVTPLPTEPGQIDVEILQDALDIDIEAVPDIGHAPLTVHFSSVLSNPPSAPLSYDWDFGDGGHATENPTTHTYT